MSLSRKAVAPPLLAWTGCSDLYTSEYKSVSERRISQQLLAGWRPVLAEDTHTREDTHPHMETFIRAYTQKCVHVMRGHGRRNPLNRTHTRLKPIEREHTHTLTHTCDEDRFLKDKLEHTHTQMLIKHTHSDVHRATVSCMFY